MSKPKFSNRDYGYQPNTAKDLLDMESVVPTDGMRMAGAIEKHSEFMKPNEGSYSDMEYDYPRPNKYPYSPINPPWPGNNWPLTKADCEGLWNKIFPDHRSKTGDFIPTQQDYQRIKLYIKSGCPMEYVNIWCCKGTKIKGPKNVEVNSVTEYSVQNTNSHCDYTWSASAGRIPGGTFYAPSTEQAVDISVSPLGTADRGKKCDTLQVIVKSSSSCISESIGISGSTQMNVGETKTLTVLNSRPGVTYTWVVSAGGGSVSPSTGTSTTYTAPGSNANCANNPTIQLKVGSNICSSVKLAVNNGSDCSSARAYMYVINIWSSMGLCIVRTQNYACNGDDCGPGQGYCDGGAGGCSGCPPCQDTHEPFTCYNIGQTLDVRTAAMKTAGCCPAALL